MNVKLSPALNRGLSCVCYSVTSIYMIIAQKYLLLHGLDYNPYFLLMFQTICSSAVAVGMKFWRAKYESKPVNNNTTTSSSNNGNEKDNDSNNDIVISSSSSNIPASTANKSENHHNNNNNNNNHNNNNNYSVHKWWDWGIAKKVCPLSILFGAMLFTSTLSLRHLRFGTFSVLKNVAPMIVYVIENRRKVKISVLGSTVFLVIGNYFVMREDFDVAFLGYYYMAQNILATVGYVLLMKAITSRSHINDKDTVFYTNLLTLCWVIPAFFISSSDERRMPDINNLTLVIMLSTGVNSILLSLASMWCIRATSGATYSMVGAVNKVPITLIGMLVEPAMSAKGTAGLFVSVFSGIAYAAAQSQNRDPKADADSVEMKKKEERR